MVRFSGNHRAFRRVASARARPGLAFLRAQRYRQRGCVYFFEHDLIPHYQPRFVAIE